MLGGIAIIVFVVLLIPVSVLMTGAVASAVLGEVLHRDGKRRHEGSEWSQLALVGVPRRDAQRLARVRRAHALAFC